MTAHRVDDRLCSQCGGVVYAATCKHGSEEDAPEWGDVFVCAQCGARLVFDDAEVLRSLTPREFASLEPELRKSVNAARRAVQGVDDETEEVADTDDADRDRVLRSR